MHRYTATSASDITDFAEAVDDRVAALLVAGTNITLTYNDGANELTIAAAASGGVTDGDKGDISVSGGGTAWMIDAGAVSLAKMADMATASLIYRKSAGAGPPEVNNLATLKTDLGLTGTNSGDQFTNVTSSRLLGRYTAGFGAAQEIALGTGLSVTGGTLDISPATSSTAGSMSAADKTRLDAMATPYRTIIEPSGSHTAARVAGTYWFGHGQPLGVTGVGTLYPADVVYIDPADYPAIGTLTAKLRLRIVTEVNDVAPTGNYTYGLYPVTRPATSGGAGVLIYTMGTVLAGSTVDLNAPAADSQNISVSADFALPASAGFYVIGVVTTAAVATSSHLHMSAMLQLHYT